MIILDYIESDSDNRLLLNILGAIVFIIVFVGFTGDLPHVTRKYMGQYMYQLVFLIFVYLVCISNRYLGILAFLLFVLQFKLACKSEAFTVSPIVYDEERTESSSDANYNLFKEDPVKRKEILRAVRSQLDFNPNKSDLARETILDIYRKYYGEDEALILKKSYDE